MFQRIDLLPLNNPEKRQLARQRWNGDDAEELHDKILGMIKEGGGEDFLQGEYERGRLGFLTNMWDLRGFDIFKEDLSFPDNDTFESIDFSYARWWNSKIRMACFFQTDHSFARFYNVHFTDCIFMLASFHGATFERCSFTSCDFIDGNGFRNSEFRASTFARCFFSENVFVDCRFDENVLIDDPSIASNRMSSEFDIQNLSGILRGIKESFSSGGVREKSQRFHFCQLQAYTRHNITSPMNRARSLLWEWVTGYGLRPARVLATFIFVFLLSYSWFGCRLGDWRGGFIIAAGAFLTFGAKSEILSKLPILDNAIYILTSFAGVALISLFVTVLANVLMRSE